MEKLKIGVVYWQDAEVVRRDNPPEKCPTMESMGRIKVFNDRVVVFHLITPDGDVSNMIHTTIPKGCIERIEYLCPKLTGNAPRHSHQKPMR